MKLYLAIKYHADLANKNLIERICNIVQKDHHVTCIHRDLEKWGEYSFPVAELMENSFQIIENSDAVLIEYSERGVGIGIEAGFATARHIPVYVLLPKGKELSPTMKGICTGCFVYETDEDIRQAVHFIAKQVDLCR